MPVHGQPDAPNLLEHMVEAELTPELRSQFERLGSDWLDSDKQTRMTTELGGKINEAYHHTIGDIAGLHEGKNYTEDFGKEAYRMAKQLFENDKTDYIHNREQARKVASKFMLHVLHEMGTVQAHAIAHAYEHAEGGKTDEERFEYLKGSFHEILGINPQDQNDRERTIDGLIAKMTGTHRAKQHLLAIAAKLKDKYAGHIAEKKVTQVVTDDNESAYKAFVEEKAGTQNLHASHAKTAFHRTGQWAAIHSDMLNFEKYQIPYQNLYNLGMEPGHGH